MGEDMKAGREKDWTKDLADKADVSNVPKVPREKYPLMKPEDRKTNFKEVGIGFDEAQAIAEALALSGLRYLFRMLSVRGCLYCQGH